MSPRSRHPVCGLAFGLLLWLGLAQGSAGQTGPLVFIDTNLPSAVLYADSARLGPIGDGLVRVLPSAKQLRLVPEADAWSIEPLTHLLPDTAAPGDTLRFEMRFPYHYAIESIPFGAHVYLEENGQKEALGTTPILYRAEAPLTGMLILERQGYDEVRLAPGADVWNRDVFVLDPLIRSDAPTAEVDWNPPSSRRTWIDYAAIGLAAAGGATAVYYKFKADDRYEAYQRTGDPELRPEFRRYDLYSGVALGTMQVGLGVFALRLVLR
ncbi:MAG: hypothetical protein ACR2GR_08075 [Rhodothermales bacterium]